MRFQGEWSQSELSNSYRADRPPHVLVLEIRREARNAPLFFGPLLASRDDCHRIRICLLSQ